MAAAEMAKSSPAESLIPKQGREALDQESRRRCRRLTHEQHILPPGAASRLGPPDS